MFWINLSGQSLAQAEFADFVRTAVRDADLPSGSIGFEITENAAIGNLEPAQRFMSRLRELGCSFALDDFGTGLSSLKYLKDLRVSMLKIDGSFIRDLLRDPRSDSLVRAVLRVAGELHLETTAECIETPEVALHLSNIGVTYGQGFELCRTGPLKELLACEFGAGLIAVRGVSAPLQLHNPCPRGRPADDPDLLQRSIGILHTLDRQHRALDAWQALLDVPIAERRTQPDVVPAPERRIRIRMMARQLAAQIALDKRRARCRDAAHRHLLHPHVWREHDQAPRGTGRSRRVDQRDRTAVAVSEQHRIGDVEALEQFR
jgi:EAL domain-containing protein (putative c-di-GMP-specific phosphodiesterase class I)